MVREVAWFLDIMPGKGDPSSPSISHRMGGWCVPLTSTRLAHEGHDLARGEGESEVLEHLEAGAAGVTGAKRDPQSDQIPGP